MSQVNEYIYALPQNIALESNVNDLEINSTYLKVDSDGAYEITGLFAPVSEDHLAAVVIANVSAYALTLKNNDSNSTSGNRFKSQSGNVVVPAGYIVQLRKIDNFFYILSSFPA
jgi:hypothetical protein